MSNRLAIFIDDHACCALTETATPVSDPATPRTSPASLPTAPTLALSSQVLMPAAADAGNSGVLVCDLMHDSDIAQKRLSTDLGSAYEQIGLAQALEPAAPQHQLERYLTALIAACLRLADPSSRIQEVVIAIPLRSREYHPERPKEHRELALDDSKLAKDALSAITPLFEGIKFFLADAHELARQAAGNSFTEAFAAGNQSAVVALWNGRFSILHLTRPIDGGEPTILHGASTLLIQDPQRKLNAQKATVGTQIAKSLAPTSGTLVDDIDQRFRLVPPQMPLDTPGHYGGLDAKLSAALQELHPSSPDFETKVLNTTAPLKVANYTLIGSLAINPAICEGVKGGPGIPALSQTLGSNLGPATCLNLHPVMSVLDQAMQIHIGAGVPSGAATSALVSSLGGQSTENRAAGILPTKIAEAHSTFSVGTTSGKHPMIEIITLPSDKGYEVMVEYGHLEDGSITLKARLDRRVLPLKKAELNNDGTEATDASIAQATVQKEARLELLEDGGYRLTLNDEHREACQLRGTLRRLVTQGLRLHGSLGKENEAAS